MQLAIQRYGHENSSDQPDVVLIHGTGANSQLWEPQVELLVKQGHRCFLPNLRGHGATDEPGEHTDADVHMDDLLETLVANQVRFPAIFVGHSLGAIISVCLAQRNPELFKQILAVSMPAKVMPVVSKIFEHFFVRLPYENIRGTFFHKSLSKRNQMMVETQRHSLEQIVDHFSGVNFVSNPIDVSCPVHFCVGRLDVVAPYFYVNKMHRLLPNSTLRIFEWAGHCCMDDQPDEFNRWFLEKIKSGHKIIIPTI